MKRYYKVYAQGVEELHPVQRLSKPKLNDALWEAIDYQACNFLDDRYSGTFSGLPEAEAIKEEALHNLAYDLWDKGEEIGCGDWGLVQVDEDDEEPSRPCKWL